MLCSQVHRLSLLSVLLSTTFVSAQVTAVNSPNGQPLAQRVTAYTIDAQLNTDAKTLDATEILDYRNPTNQPLSTIPFHLYLNAFRSQSTFTQESHEDGTDITYAPGEEGSIEIKTIAAEGYGDLSKNMQFTAPDDGNIEDHTVMEVALPKPLAPGEVIRFQIGFHDKFPLAVARSGYKRDFIMGGQWFPKPGVMWHGAWNCHQYHEDTEFFADFGTYNVNLRLPERFSVGASGIQIGELHNADGTKTASFRGEDIHDFAWAASPHFQAVDDTFVNSLGTVKIHALILASHAGKRARYLSVLKQSLQKYDEWLGPYPYKQITFIDPEPDAPVSGMEYPTLITGDANWWEPAWSHYWTETTTVHEFGHQYWYGMVASNEFEEPWLDEGINTYTEAKVMGSIFGKNTSLINGRTVFDSDLSNQRFFYLMHPDRDPIVRLGWKFASDESYVSIVYNKTPAALLTLESVVGEDTVRRALRVYFMRYRFTHPTGDDLLHVLAEVSGHDDLQTYFAQAFQGTQGLDYAVDSLDTGPMEWWKGQHAGEPFHSSVMLSRKGAFVFPVKVEVGFADGSKEQAAWDGKDRWARFTWDKASPAKYAQVDASNAIQLDLNSFNNSYVLQADNTARLKLTNDWVFAQQLMGQWLAFLI